MTWRPLRRVRATTREPTVTIDLVKLITLTVDQVHGGDERMHLRDFLSRNTEEQQPVRVRLADVVVTDET